jgi:N-acyl-phosphatidylethanolamine-hydrolysing phospholipase D
MGRFAVRWGMEFQRANIIVVAFVTIALFTTSSITLWAWAPSSEPRPDETLSLGPAPRDADGRFENWNGVSAHGTLGVRLPFFLRRARGLFRNRPGEPARLANDGAFLRENARHSEPTVTWVGHATLLVQTDHVTFLTDPIWSDTPSPISFAGPRRFVPPGLAIEDLPPIDFVVISHYHYDHLDLPTLRTLAERDAGTRFFVPLGNAILLHNEGIKNIEEFDWGDSTRHGDVTIHCLPAQHWSKRGLGDDRKALWSSWAIEGQQRKFYFSGDTGYFDGFSRIGESYGPFDLVAVPIGAYEPSKMMKDSHMNPEEAVRAAIDLDTQAAIAIHFGTFDLSDEPLDEPPQRFRAAAQASSLGTDAAWVFKIGETRRF